VRDFAAILGFTVKETACQILAGKQEAIMNSFIKPISSGVAIAIMCLMAITAVARLGESDVEISKRYGAIQKRIDDSTNKWKGAYFFKDYKIMVSFETNRSVTEMLAPLNNRKFETAEVSALRDAIGGAGTWT
jgi:hypothetical protein